MYSNYNSSSNYETGKEEALHKAKLYLNSSSFSESGLQERQNMKDSLLKKQDAELQIVVLIENSKHHALHHKVDYNVKFDIFVIKHINILTTDFTNCTIIL